MLPIAGVHMKAGVLTRDLVPHGAFKDMVSSSVGICKEICLITVGLTEANVATVLAGWLSK